MLHLISTLTEWRNIMLVVQVYAAHELFNIWIVIGCGISLAAFLLTLGTQILWWRSVDIVHFKVHIIVRDCHLNVALLTQLPPSNDATYIFNAINVIN